MAATALSTQVVSRAKLFRTGLRRLATPLAPALRLAQLGPAFRSSCSGDDYTPKQAGEIGDQQKKFQCCLRDSRDVDEEILHE